MQQEQIQKNIFLGDAKNCPASPRESAFALWMQAFQSSQQLTQLVFLKQEHTNKGRVITDLAPVNTIINEFIHVGDYIVTNQLSIGIGVLTADCLPIVLSDEINGVIAVVHAGWKGLLQGVIQNCVHDMLLLGAVIKNIEITIGAHAQICCYQVQQDFVQNVGIENKRFIVQKDDKLFFDIAACAITILKDMGIASEKMCAVHVCTICNDAYYSYRRDPNSYNRQSTIAWLK